MNKKEVINKTKSLFDHLNEITNHKTPKYVDTLDEGEKKKWTNYLLIRYLSMNTEWVYVMSELQPLIQQLSPSQFYDVMVDIIPKGKVYLKYLKAKKKSGLEEVEDWIVDLVAKFYQVSKKEAEDYLEILYKTEDGHKKIKEIAESYGTETKMIKKLKLKV